MTTISNHIINSRRLKRGTLYLAGLLLSGLGGWSTYQHVSNLAHPYGTRFSRAQIKNRAIQIGLALNGSVRLVADPILHLEQARLNASHFTKRKMWIVLCESDHRQINLSIDDATGYLICMVMDGGNAGRLNQDSPADIKTAQEAVVKSAERLRVLKTLPQTAEIALREKPVEEKEQNIWYVNWLVRNTTQSTPYTIKMSLNRHTGQPTYLINLEKS